ncbi:NADH:ubiquinone reductase (Na(+)-transporting) subunit C [bacterium]|nr:NADH:ubiquinone reductase (Na(+)-transporting) subunit C [bacterium]
MRSNFYVLSFMAVITIILGFLLSYSSAVLKARQDYNIDIDIKKNILKSLNIPADQSKKLSQGDIQKLYDEEITSININEKGIISENGTLSVYIAKDGDQPTGYSIPISGKGLWSTIYGYLALEPDGNTIKGITFYQHGETPGLGGELEKDWFTANYVGKKIYNSDGMLVSVEIVKGQVNQSGVNAIHQVDGISGATLTGKGLNNFIAQDLNIYKPFLDRIRVGENILE